MNCIPPIFLLSLLPCHAAGFANGVKIGEVTENSAVLWTRLTENPEAGNQVKKWKKDSPNWTVPGAEGKVRFIYYKNNDREKNDLHSVD